MSRIDKEEFMLTGFGLVKGRFQLILLELFLSVRVSFSWDHAHFATFHTN